LPDTPVEHEWMARLKSGDPDALESLYAAYSERVWRYAARLIGADANSVADVVQETFLSVMRFAHQYDSARGSVANWMLAIAHRAALGRWRSLERDRSRQSSDNVLRERHGRLAYWFDGPDDPADLLEDSETAELVRGCLAELEESHSFCLVTKYIDGWSTAEMAAANAESQAAVRSRLTRARAAFRQSFLARVRDAEVAAAMKR